MNSKKNKFVPAFSLAEALITLLVVCLITLASIPVLTKKKRTTSASEHGRWMCTLNSQGKHVVWSTNSSGSIDNPDSWDRADSDSCTFVPPINARNFAISLSGGGGGGAGVQVSEGGSTTWNSSFAVNVPGYYDFLAVGADLHKVFNRFVKLKKVCCISSFVLIIIASANDKGFSPFVQLRNHLTFKNTRDATVGTGENIQ